MLFERFEIRLAQPWKCRACGVADGSREFHDLHCLAVFCAALLEKLASERVFTTAGRTIEQNNVLGKLLYFAWRHFGVCYFAEIQVCFRDVYYFNNRGMYQHGNTLEYYKKLSDRECDTNARLAAEIVQRSTASGYVRVLDIGCGLAPLLPPLLQRFRDRDAECQFDYVGLDSSASMLAHNRAHCKALQDASTEISFQLADVAALNTQSEFPWFNVIIVQSLVHLIESAVVIELYKYISKCLSNDGVIYVSTAIDVDVVERRNGDVCLVRKTDTGALYERRLYTREAFEAELNVFAQEHCYSINVELQHDARDRRFLIAWLHKSPRLLYDRYHYSIGYDARLSELASLLHGAGVGAGTEAGAGAGAGADSGPKEYVHDLQSMSVIRREGFLLNLYERQHDVFLRWMRLFKEILAPLLPNCTPLYLKDKLNANPLGWKFPLHQDASAGWNARLAAHMPEPNLVTIGLPLTRVSDSASGPTRIAIRQTYAPSIVAETNDAHSIDEEAYSAQLGKPLQHLLCYGVRGSYYLFDQYVLHDSAFNLHEQSRDVLFVTLALSAVPDDARLDSIALAKTFYESKGALDKQSIEALLAGGARKEDFHRDRFGKITYAPDATGTSTSVNA